MNARLQTSCLVHISAHFQRIATAMSSQSSQILTSNFQVFASVLICGQAPRRFQVFRILKGSVTREETES